jgi:putative flippase GtrA
VTSLRPPAAGPDAAPDPAPLPAATPARLIRAVLGDRRFRYLLVGGVSAVVYYGLFSAGWLLSGGRIPYLAMAVIANFLCCVSTYPLYRRGVFGSTGAWLPGLVRFYVVCLWALVFSLVGLPLLIEVGHVPVLIAQAIIIVVSPVINYQISKYWAFRR